MKLSIGRGLFLLCALLVCGAAAPAARGDALSGTLEFQFTDDDQIWDFGGFSDCDTVSEDVPGIADPVVVTICIVLDMTPDARGNYEGPGQVVFTQDIQGTLDGTAKGKLRGRDVGPGASDRKDKADFKLKAEGNLNIGSGPFVVPTKVLISCKGLITAGIYDTLCHVTVKLEGYGSATAKNVPYTHHADGGDWSATINNLTLVDETHYSGVATDSLGYSYIVTGKYDANHDDSSLLLKGLKDGNSNGAKIQLKDLVSDAPSTAAGEAKYKLQGYKGSADVATD
jgi:hypothetical protein